jgi:molecular chaperone GrpE
MFFREIHVTEPTVPAPGKGPDTPVAEMAPSPPGSPGERIAELEAQLAAAQAQAARLSEDFLRAKAEAENTRRRAAEDVARAHKFGIETFATSLLAVRDSLEAALAVEGATGESLRQGVEITQRQLASAFEKAALAPIDPLGGKFDPHRHQALSQVDADQEAGTVVAVVQKGYLLHDRVIRPALVMVSRGKPASAGEAPPSA